MSEPESSDLGLNKVGSTPSGEPVPQPEALQFRRAEHAADAPADVKHCVICKQAIPDTYYQVQGQTVCPPCAKAVEAAHQAPPAHSLLKAFFYGLGAAIAGSALYAIVAIVTGLELALIAILIGYMVGKAIRHASKGLGGRPQQILAVLLTYFAITTSYIPVGIYQYVRQHREQSQPAQVATPGATNSATPEAKPLAPAAVAISLLMLAFAAPFMSLGEGVSGILSLVIIFFGLQRAWKLTGRRDILVTGPYQAGA